MKLNTLATLLLLATPTVASSTEISTFILNGTSTSSTTWPSVAAVYYDAVEYGGSYGQLCTATMLDSTHVLTAAHCLYDGDGNVDTELLMGLTVLPQLTSDDDYLSGASPSIRATKFYVHDGYIDSGSEGSVPWPNDIAIVEVEETFNVDDSSFTDLADQDDALSYRIDDTEFTVLGYGLDEDSESGDLLETTLNYESAENCDLTVGDSQICTSGEFNTETRVRNSVCDGDSGGPLFWNNGTEYVQIGLSSYGWAGCFDSTTDDTSVFTETADYQDWVAGVLAGTVAATVEITDEERDEFFETVSASDSGASSTSSESGSYSTTSSSSSGGSTTFLGLLSMLALAVTRIRKKADNNFGDHR